MTNRPATRLLALLIFCLPGTNPLMGSAQAGVLTGREVMNRIKMYENGKRHWTDRWQRLTLRTFAKSGKNRVKEMELYEKRYDQGRRKALVFFLAPAEIKGTGFLQWSDPEVNDKQWLYLPQLKRIRRISPRAKDESFAGTTFSYRDLEIINQLAAWTEAQARAQLVGEEEIDGSACHIVSLRPAQDSKGYDKLQVWVSKSEFQIRKMEFEKTAEGLRKVLLLRDFRAVDGISTAHWSEMRNLKKGTRTIVETQKINYNEGFGDELFTRRRLERGHR